MRSADANHAVEKDLLVNYAINNMKNTSTFKSKHSNEVHQIKKTLSVIIKWWYI